MEKEEETGKTSRRQYITGIVGLGVGAAVGYGIATAVTPPAPAPGEVRTVTVTETKTGPGEVAYGVGGTLRVSQAYEPITVNPNITMAGDVWGAQVEHMVFDRLVDVLYDRTGKSIVHVPMIATKWIVEDEGKTYIFNIREGVKWHKGYGELTAEDVAWNVNDTVQNKRARVSVYYFVKKAEVLDDYQVAIYLEKPFAPFLSTIAYQGLSLIPKKAYEEIGHEAFGHNPVGSGPFEFDKWMTGDYIRLKKFKDYWKEGIPMVDEIIYKPMPDLFTKTQALLAGELDIVDNADYKDIASLEQNPDLRVSRIDGWNFDFISFRIDKLAKPDESPFQNVKVRQAVNYAVDREEIVKSVYYGYARPTVLPLMPHDLGYTTKKYFPDTADLDMAKKLLDEAGYGDGFEFTVITGMKSNLKREIEVVQAQLAKVNIKMNIELMEYGAWVSQYWIDPYQKKFIAAHGDVDRVTDDADSGMWWFYHTDTIGWNGLDAPGVDQILEEARTTLDTVKRHELYLKALDIVIPASQYVYLVTRQLAQPTRKNVHGFYSRPKENFYQFDEVYLSE